MYNTPGALAFTGAALSFLWLPLGIVAIVAALACLWRARSNRHGDA